MGKQEILWDEELIKAEVDAIKEKEAKRELHEIRNRIREKESNQKSIQSYYKELKEGFAEIDGVRFTVEMQSCFDHKISVPVIVDDMEYSDCQEKMVMYNYNQLEMSMNLIYINDIIKKMSPHAYMLEIRQQVKEANLIYEPVESGYLISGDNKLVFSSGITESPMGYLFNLSFYILAGQDSLTGGFTCRLRSRYSRQNLFKAMIQCFYEKEKA